MSLVSNIKLTFPPRQPRSFSKFFFVLCLLAITLFNAVDLIKTVKDVYMFKKVLPYQNIGYKFAGLEEFVKGEEIVGYYTDNDLNQQEHSKQFSHAQFILAPTILDLNNLEHEYIIFFCSKESVAWQEMEKIGAAPWRINQFGVILARKDIFANPGSHF